MLVYYLPAPFYHWLRSTPEAINFSARPSCPTSGRESLQAENGRCLQKNSADISWSSGHLDKYVWKWPCLLPQAHVPKDPDSVGPGWEPGISSIASVSWDQLNKQIVKHWIISLSSRAFLGSARSSIVCLLFCSPDLPTFLHSHLSTKPNLYTSLQIAYSLPWAELCLKNLYHPQGQILYHLYSKCSINNLLFKKQS